MRVVLGIDPGSRVAGFGVINCAGELMEYVTHGSIVLSDRLSFAGRLLQLGDELGRIYDRYAPHITVIEKIFLGKNADSAFRLGHARGVCLYQAARAQSEVFEYATRSVKKGITGSGAADKHMVQMILMAQFGLSQPAQSSLSSASRASTTSLDASDALALAVYHARQLAVAENVEQARVRVRIKELL